MKIYEVCPSPYGGVEKYWTEDEVDAIDTAAEALSVELLNKKRKVEVSIEIIEVEEDQFWKTA